MSQENVEIVCGGFAAFNEGDFDRVSKFVDPEIEYHTSVEDPGAASPTALKASAGSVYEMTLMALLLRRVPPEPCLQSASTPDALPRPRQWAVTTTWFPASMNRSAISLTLSQAPSQGKITRPTSPSPTPSSAPPIAGNQTTRTSGSKHSGTQ